MSSSGLQPHNKKKPPALELVEAGLKQAIGIFAKPVVRAWLALFECVLWRRSKVTTVWRQVWTVGCILCCFCIFGPVRSFQQPWQDFLLSGFGCEIVLLLLCLQQPFPSRLSFWRLAFFPTIGVWAPYLIRVVLGPEQETPWDKLREKHKIPIPKIWEPDAYYRLTDSHCWLRFSPQLACLVFTLLIVATSLWFGTFKLDFCAADHLKTRLKELQVSRTSRARPSRSKQEDHSG